tara:strand:- start:6 stop:173 length:168 start_codon:yes stop_codon:yes gene_type:complete
MSYRAKTYQIKTVDGKQFVIRLNTNDTQTGCTEGTVDYEEYLEWAKTNTAEPFTF